MQDPVFWHSRQKIPSLLRSTSRRSAYGSLSKEGKLNGTRITLTLPVVGSELVTRFLDQGRVFKQKYRMKVKVLWVRWKLRESYATLGKECKNFSLDYGWLELELKATIRKIPHIDNQKKHGKGVDTERFIMNNIFILEKLPVLF